MTPPQPAEPAAPDQRPLSRAVIIAVLAASLMVGAFAITSQSYWIDEGLSLIVAMSSSPAEAWKYAQAVSGSTIQMPLYHIYLFAWHKIFDGSEWTMRASNLPWFLLGQLAFLILLRHRPRLALTTALLAAVSPVIWMYLDETRPYLMQYAAACWLVAAIVRLSCPPHSSPPTTTRHSSPTSPPTSSHSPLVTRHSSPTSLPTSTHSPLVTRHSSLLLLALGLATLTLFGSSLLGVLWGTGFLAALAWLYFTAPTIDNPAPLPTRHTAPATSYLLLSFALFALALLAYYAWTWSIAGEGHHRAGANLMSLPYIAYEFLGFTGFGPDKLRLRLDPLRSLAAKLPVLLPLAATLTLLGLFALRTWREKKLPRRTAIAWLLALVGPTFVIVIGLFLFQHRALPRHFIPLLPALLVGLAALLTSAFTSKSALWRSVAVLLPLLWLGSSLNFRWQPAHAKDDYRTAAAIAAAALRENKEVWWAADAAAAYIYLTPVALEEVPGRAWAMQAPSWDAIRFKFPPRLIVISKPDIYDPQGSVTRYAAENQFTPSLQLQAFTIFTRRQEDLPTVPPRNR
jgi:hypothetical protein